MSNYVTKVRMKSTGEIFEVTALDDFFGKHKYGYYDMSTPAGDMAVIYREDEVEHIEEISPEICGSRCVGRY